LSHQRGEKQKKPKKQTKKNTTKCPKFKCNTVSVSFQHAAVVQLLSHQRREKKKKSLPAAGSLLLLEALFMQISGMSLTLT
jgi:hypothetical protein